MKRRLLPIALAGLAVVAAGCSRGDDDDATAASAAPAATAPTTSVAAAPAGAAAVAAKVGESDLGQLIVGEDGLTLYGFTNDVDAISTCYSTCAEAWPPVIVDAEWTVGPGLDTGIFSTTTREDGSLQLVAGKFPLYGFGGDANPGDLTGQGSGDVWFAVNLDGTLLTEGAAPAAPAAPTDAYGAPVPTAAPALPALPTVQTAPTELGDVLVDQDGLTLYGFTQDEDGTPTCNDACADAWPPMLVDGPDLPADLDPEVFSVVERDDGEFQLKAGKWPLYRFAGDAAPGDTNGQGSGDVWFVVDPLGGLIKNAG